MKPLLIVFAVVTTCSSTPPSVRLPCNVTILGYDGSDDAKQPLWTYKGIPYAQPPVQDLRFRPAVPLSCPAAHGGVFDATHEPHACMQNANPVLAGRSEDCLKLNVVTPASSAPRGGRHVIAWIYGGSLVEGSTTFYMGLNNLANQHDACVVAFNYRLGVFGFLAVKDLAAGDARKTAGNYGLTDVVAALQWIQDNIEAFGCDPNSVSLYGQSSGGTLITALLATPSASKLYHRVISLSASVWIDAQLEQVQDEHMEFVKGTVCASKQKDELVACLQGLPADNILKSTPVTWNADASIMRPGLSPDGFPSLVHLMIVDGVTVPQPVFKYVAENDISKPAIFTANRDEHDLEPLASVANWTQADLVAFFESNFTSPPNATSTLLSIYKDRPDPVQTFYDLSGDASVICPTLVFMKHLRFGSSSKNLYFIENNFSPTTPFRFLPLFGEVRYPFHLWTYILANGAWSFPAILSGGTFKPSTEELDASQLLQRVVSEFLSDNVSSLTDIGDDRSIDGNVLELDGNSATLRAVKSYKSQLCEDLYSIQLDSRFWWIN